ncbi:MAG: hypothetical protein V2B15_10565 [Bacteroidota bacterium]
MKSPFKFLDAYTHEDRTIFFGRDREIEELYQKVFESKILLVYGISGTGKSSLINCGLANKFEESDWLPISIRRGKDINQSLESEIRKASITELKDGVSIRNALQSVYLDHFKPVYLIFDQFEELFIFGKRQERDDFIRTITELIQSDIHCKCLFSIREEYLANMTEFEQVIDHILDNRIRVEKMTRVHAVDVIEGPCRVQQIDLEEGFAARLLEKLSPDSNEIELTFLQVFLDRIFRMSGKEGDDLKFTNEMIGKVGDVSNLLGDFLEEQIRELEDPDAGMTLLKAFVSVKGTKRQVEDSQILDSVRALGKNISPEEITVLVQKFIKLRILRDKDENGRYELRHDSLAAKIYENITLVEKELLEIRQFIENAFDVWQKRGILLDKDDLDYIAPYEKKLFLEEKSQDFVEKCRRSLEVKKRSFRRIMAISAAGFLLILSAIAIYSFRFSFSRKADRLAQISSLQREFSLPLSYYTAKAALAKDPKSSFAVKALFDAFYGLLEGGPYYDSAGHLLDPQKTIFDFSPVGSEIENAGFSEDGSLIYGTLENGTVKIWDRQGHELFSKADSTAQVIDMIISPDNQTIAVVFRDSTATFWDLSGRFITSVSLSYEPVSPKDAVAFSRDSRTFAITGRENQIAFYNVTGDFLYEMHGHSEAVTGLSFSPDSQYLASSSKDSSIMIWKLDDDLGMFTEFRRFDKTFGARVWSVDFAQNSRWILCTSETFFYKNEKDTFWVVFYDVIDVVNFNGSRKFIVIARTSSTEKDPRYQSKLVYGARFTADDAAIVYHTIDSVGTNNGNEMILSLPRYRLEFSKNSLRWMTNTNRSIRKDNILENTDPYTLNGADFSVQGFVASSITNSATTNLSHYDEIPIRKFKGNHPVFSNDGNYLLCISENKLCLYPASTTLIMDLVDGRKIFGEIEGNLSDWRHYVTQ